MVKLIYLMKRTEGLTHEEFRDYYENVHTKLIRHAPRGVVRYRRRYLSQMSNPFDDLVPRGSFDVITEIWFEDEGSFHAALRDQDPETARLIVEDEERFVDRPATLMFTLEDCETDLSAVGA